MNDRDARATLREIGAEAGDLKRQLQGVFQSIESALASGGADTKQIVNAKAPVFLELATRLVDTTATDAIQAARIVTGRTVETVEEMGGQAVRCVERTVRDRPLTSLLLAFGAGWMGSTIFGRR